MKRLLYFNIFYLALLLPSGFLYYRAYLSDNINTLIQSQGYESISYVDLSFTNIKFNYTSGATTTDINLPLLLLLGLNIINLICLIIVVSRKRAT